MSTDSKRIRSIVENEDNLDHYLSNLRGIADLIGLLSEAASMIEPSSLSPLAEMLYEIGKRLTEVFNNALEVPS